jgi:hypothetical protein
LGVDFSDQPLKETEMKYLFVLLLAGCATQWTKEGATNADLDYEECRKVATADGPGIAPVFGAVGAFIGSGAADEKIRGCLTSKGWNKK